MNKFLDSLLGGEGPKLSLIVAILVVGYVVINPFPNLLNRVGVEVNQNLAAGVPSCEGRLQWKSSTVGAACSKTSGCMWSGAQGKCVSRTTGTTGGTGGSANTGTTASSPVSVTPQCNGTIPTVAISWPSKGNTDHWVDIATNPQFSNNSNKNTPKGALSTIAPEGFSNSLALKSGIKYYVRVYYPSSGERTSAASFTAKNCGGGGTPTPAPAGATAVTQSGPVSVDLKVNGKDGPFVATAQTVNISWTSKNAVSCDKTINERYFQASAEVKHSVPLQNSAGDTERLLSDEATASVVIVCTGSDGKLAIDSVDFGETDNERRGYGKVERIDPDGTVTGFARIGLGDAPFDATIICDSPDINSIGGRQGRVVPLDQLRPDLGNNFRGFTATIPDKCRDGNKHLLDIIAKGVQRPNLDWFVIRALRFSVPSH